VNFRLTTFSIFLRQYLLILPFFLLLFQSLNARLTYASVAFDPPSIANSHQTAQTSSYYCDFFTPLLRQAVLHIQQLQVQDARNRLEQEQWKNPKNYAVLLFMNYLEYLEIMISEDPAVVENYRHNESKRLKEIQKIHHPGPLLAFVKAEIIMQWALVKLRMNDTKSATLHIRDAYKILSQNQKKYPLFLPQYKHLGWIQSFTASIPSGYHWMVNMMGVSTDFSKGISYMDKALLEDASYPLPAFMMKEAAYLRATVAVYIEKDKQKCRNLIQQYVSEPFQNLDIALSSMMYYMSGDNELMLERLEQFYPLQGVIPFPSLDFLKGVGLLRKGDASCVGFFKQYLSQFKGNTNKAVANYYLAVHFYLQGQMAQSDFYLKETQKKQHLHTEQDKQAGREAQAGLGKCKPLLQARFQFDGGYYQEALASLQLAEKDIRKWDNIPQKEGMLELNYRKARVFHLMKKETDALAAYTLVVQHSQQSSKHFGPYAAIYMGEIFEENEQYAKALTYYNRALTDFKNNEEYRHTIEQKAKSGLNRVKKIMGP
jgi:tetratricopeptide (TPR) repeat protein